MKIVIIGDGKVGYKLAKQLSSEKYDIILIDNNEEKLRKSIERMDVFCVVGEGGSVEVQQRADVPHKLMDMAIACGSGDCLHFYGRVQYAQLSDREKAGRTAYDCPGKKSDLL